MTRFRILMALAELLLDASIAVGALAESFLEDAEAARRNRRRR